MRNPFNLVRKRKPSLTTLTISTDLHDVIKVFAHSRGSFIKEAVEFLIKSALEVEYRDEEVED